MSHFVFPSIFSTPTLSITSNLQLITFRFYPLTFSHTTHSKPMRGITYATQKIMPYCQSYMKTVLKNSFRKNMTIYAWAMYSRSPDDMS